MSYRPEDDPYMHERPKLYDAHDVYLAGPFFTPPQVNQNKWLADMLFKYRLKAFAPARDCRYKPGDPKVNADRAFWLNRYHIEHCKFILADLCWPDSGTAWELGYADAIGRPKLGIVGSWQQGLNLMLRNTVDGLITLQDTEGVLGSLSLDIKERGRHAAAAIARIGFAKWHGEQL